MRKWFEKFILKFDVSQKSTAPFKAFNKSDVKLELIVIVKSARTKRQLSAAIEDGDFSHWDQLVVDLEEILRKNST